jgi:hypothetical protein
VPGKLSGFRLVENSQDSPQEIGRARLVDGMLGGGRCDYSRAVPLKAKMEQQQLIIAVPKNLKERLASVSRSGPPKRATIGSS